MEYESFLCNCDKIPKQMCTKLKNKNKEAVDIRS